jgi:Icc-related predicted phosphoesterase
MISSGWTNPTPWNTYRECSEDELAKKIEAMASEVKDLKNCIFALHAPPYGSGLDEAPELDKDFRPVLAGRQKIFAGSKAVHNAIEKFQPLLGLHGHIHESRGSTRIGRTLCVNPGSMYTEGFLMGYLFTLDEKGIKNYSATSG